MLGGLALIWGLTLGVGAWLLGHELGHNFGCAHETGYVFTDFDGSPFVPDWLSKDFCGLVRSHGLPQLTFHGLRHAFATLGLKAGISPKVVSEALGHSSVGITLDIYSHVLPNMQNELSQAVANLLKRKPQTT